MLRMGKFSEPFPLLNVSKQRLDAQSKIGKKSLHSNDVEWGGQLHKD